ncbi:MAG: hypothetical protein M9928_09375 [Anaerolineae bacterium]|nr:hypothetical protein [Anaerolineae bacterium]MCO5189291.1 hypothetical protein [Anaerolineae bacterium]MCO5192914.1 hypothetical protein [Anaerolineae bacterium]MCO5198319.1 hypothetical protein [Anaerolineae bacterium]MCO5205231.1 hypothetical protein [Anaerolineae bacterium]
MTQQMQVVEQKTIVFYDDELIAVKLEDGRTVVPVKPICDALGVNWDGQRQRITRDDVLSAESVTCTVITTAQGSAPQGRAMLCLPDKYISGFLFGISARRVKPELKETLIRYQRECYDVLSQAFFSGRLTSHTAIMSADSPAAQAYKIAMAVAEIARHQWVMEQRIDSAETRIADLETVVEQLGTQLAAPSRVVSDEQASQISQAVRAVGMVLSKRSGRNEYGGVYGELYRREGVTSYKLLPAKQFAPVMEWLSTWYQELTDETDVPF